MSVARWDDHSFGSSSCEFSKPGSKTTITLKSVSFAPRAQVFAITHLDEIPDDVVASIWYDSKEYSAIKSAYQATIFLMEAGETITGTEHTTRGLEYRTQEGAWARYENKRDAYNAVLDEQDRQWKRDADDDEAIRQVYLEHSAKCLAAAQKRGLQDAKAVEEFLRAPTRKLTDKLKLRKKKKKTSTKPGDESDGGKKSRRNSMTGVEKKVKLDKRERRSSTSSANVTSGTASDSTSSHAQLLLKARSNLKRTEIRDDIKRQMAKSKEKQQSN